MKRDRSKMDYWQFAEVYNKCMKVLEKIYCRWYGSAWGLSSTTINHMADLIIDEKTSYSRYEREMNDKIYFDQYGQHLYKRQEGKDVTKYVL